MVARPVRATYKEYSYQELLDLRKTNWDEYARLFEAEYKYKPEYRLASFLCVASRGNLATARGYVL